MKQKKYFSLHVPTGPEARFIHLAGGGTSSFNVLFLHYDPVSIATPPFIAKTEQQVVWDTIYLPSFILRTWVDDSVIKRRFIHSFWSLYVVPFITESRADRARRPEAKMRDDWCHRKFRFQKILMTSDLIMTRTKKAWFYSRHPGYWYFSAKWYGMYYFVNLKCERWPK